MKWVQCRWCGKWVLRHPNSLHCSVKCQRSFYRMLDKLEEKEEKERCWESWYWRR